MAGADRTDTAIIALNARKIRFVKHLIGTPRVYLFVRSTLLRIETCLVDIGLLRTNLLAGFH
jgi:hypothetical protein